MSTVPESFDGMLAELADTAASSVSLPDISVVRRRARQRVTHRRLTASALAFALLCVAGAAGTAIDVHSRHSETVIPLSAPGLSSSAQATGSATGSPTGTGATAVPSSNATSAASARAEYAPYAGVWSEVATQNGTVIVFPDGVVALSQSGAFPMCYARLASGSAASPVSTGASNPSVFESTLPFIGNSCDSTSVTRDLVLDDKTGTLGLTLETPGQAKAGYSVAYARALGLSALLASGGGAMFKQLVGDWIAVKDPREFFNVGDNGRVAFVTDGATGGSPGGTGVIDAYYSVGARVLTNCSTTAQQDTATSPAIQGCGVLLLALGAKPGELTVYTGAGAEVFERG